MNQSRTVAIFFLIVSLLVVALLTPSCATVATLSTPTTEPTIPAPTDTVLPSPTASPGLDLTHLRQLETVYADYATQSFIEAPTQTAAVSTQHVERRITGTAHVFAAATAQYQLGLTAQAIVAESPAQLPYFWPLILSDQQIEAAKSCDIWTIYEERYSEVRRIGQLAETYDPQTACDWASLATAYVVFASENEVPIPEVGRQSFLVAFGQNPALALYNPLFFGYIGESSLVEAPPLTGQPLVTALLQFTFGGIGYESNFKVLITNADTSPVARVIGEEYNGFSQGGPEESDLAYNGPISYNLVQDLGHGLTDLIPVEERFNAFGCYDYYPNWNVILTYADGTSLHILTNGSNVMGGGGPWQVTIAGQNYVQASGVFPAAITAITDVLNLPGGATAAVSCSSPDDLLDLGYPLPDEE